MLKHRIASVNRIRKGRRILAWSIAMLLVLGLVVSNSGIDTYAASDDLLNQEETPTSSDEEEHAKGITQKGWLTFSSENPFALIAYKKWEGTVAYSFDGETENEWKVADESNNSVKCTKLIAEKDAKSGWYVIYFRGTGNKVISSGSNWILKGTETDGNSNVGDIYCNGNIENLLDYTLVERGEHPKMGESCFNQMFRGWSRLKQAPELPAIQLARSCYSYMFNGCASLEQAPELPAIYLAEMCYSYMFNGCASLTQAPELPAVDLAQGCYGNMFENCTALEQAPELPAINLERYCYSKMFNGCTSLTQAPELPAVNLEGNCYDSMFKNCTSLTQAPALIATNLAADCYSYMFSGCTALTESVELPAKLIRRNSYESMFAGCTALASLPELPAEQVLYKGYYSMFSGCSGLKIKKSDAPDGFYRTKWSLPATISCNDAALDQMFSQTGSPDEISTSDLKSGASFYYVSYKITLSNEDSSVSVSKKQDIGKGQLVTLTVNPAYGDKLKKLQFTQEDETTIDQEVLKLKQVDEHHYTIVMPDKDITIKAVYEEDNRATDYLTFYSDEEFKIAPIYSSYNNRSATLEYSTDTQTWDTYSNNVREPIEVTAGKQGIRFVLYLRGKNITAYKNTWKITGSNVSCEGNIETLLDYEKVKQKQHPTMASDCFEEMFKDCDALVKAPELPAQTLSNRCYSSMFYNCKKLQEAPYLPATELEDSCYSNMFYGCKSLKVAPKLLPATTLSSKCYLSMFEECTSLEVAPELPAKQLTASCYYSMFKNCSSLIQPPALPAKELAKSCYFNMFYFCKSLAVAPTLPAMEMKDECYEYMFNGCDSLVATPELPATIMAKSCYLGMFNGCDSLVAIPKLPATTMAEQCYFAMFSDCKSLVVSTEPIEGAQELWLPRNVTTSDAENWNYYTLPNTTIQPGVTYFISTRYEVHFMDGDQEMQGVRFQQVKKDGCVTKPDYVPAKEGYQFAKWSLTKDGAYQYDFSYPVRSNLKLYAVWKANQLDKADFKFTIPEYVYDGQEHKPVVTLKSTSDSSEAAETVDEDETSDTNENIAITNKDYTVAYENNVDAGENTASVIIKGAKNYKYSTPLTYFFTIKKATQDIAFPASFKGVAGQKLSTLSFEAGSRMSWATPDAEIAYGKQTYEVIYEPEDTKNYNCVTGTIEVDGREEQAPVITGIENNKTYQLAENETVTVTVQEEHLSYLVVNDEKVAKESMVKKAGDSYCYTLNKFGTYKVQAVDECGNESTEYMITLEAKQPADPDPGKEDNQGGNAAENTGSNPADAGNTGTNPADAGNTGADSTDAGNTGTNPADAGNTGTNPTDAGNTGTNPADAGNTGANPTDAENNGTNPTDAGNTGADPADAGNTGADPVDAGNTGADPADAGNTGADSTDAGNTGADPAGAGNTGSNPADAGNTGSNPADASNTGVDPADAGNTGVNPTDAGNTGVNPTDAGNTDANAKTSTGNAGDAGTQNGAAPDANKKETSNTTETKNEKENRTISEKTMVDNGVSYHTQNTKDKTVTLETINNNKVTKLSIPSTVTIQGTKYKVVAIAKDAFKNNKKLKSLVISKNITTIGSGAFAGCKNLKTITIKSTRLTKKSFGKNAFAKLNKNIVIKVPKKVKKKYKKLFRSLGFKNII